MVGRGRCQSVHPNAGDGNVVEVVSGHGFCGLSKVCASVLSRGVVAIQLQSSLPEVRRQFLWNYSKGPRLAEFCHVAHYPSGVWESAGPIQRAAMDIGEYRAAALGAARDAAKHGIDCAGGQVIAHTLPNENSGQARSETSRSEDLC